MSALGVIFLPSGPGLNSGPAQTFLRSTFEAAGKTIFWNEPSPARGDRIPDGSLEIWRNVVRSLELAARSFGGPFVIVAESAGSLLAERLYDELKATGDEALVAGILHTPPTLDLVRVLRRVMELGLGDFRENRDHDRETRMTELCTEFDRDPRIDSPALLAGMHLALESPVIMTHYFRNLETLGRWVQGFAMEGFAPDHAMRDQILKGMGAAGAPVRTTFSPDVPTMVCAGGFDPYETLETYEVAVSTAMVRPRKHPIAWVPFPERGHYPYSDGLDRWKAEAWEPFLRLVRHRDLRSAKGDRKADLTRV